MQVKLNVIVAAAVALLTGTVMAQDMVVKIGHVGPLTGGIAYGAIGHDDAGTPTAFPPVGFPVGIGLIGAHAGSSINGLVDGDQERSSSVQD